MNFYSDSKEWSYLFKNAVDWDTILPLYYPSFPTEDGFKNKEELLAFYEEILVNTGDWTANKMAPRARRLDAEGSGKIVNGHVEIGPCLKELYEEAKNLEVFGLGVSKEYGGLGLPMIVPMLAFTQMNRACISSATQLGFYTTIVDMIERFCDKETKEKFVPMIVRGEISGSMCLTEPGAGSDVGSLRTNAMKQDNGSYLINGAKIFITNGGGGLGFVLARIKGAPEGLEGISLFFAEEWLQEDGNKKENYRITKIEEKMGLHGSMTCEVLYENTKAILVGKENEGFKVMLHLMNEARLGVGIQTLGGIEACLHQMRSYAETRTQFKRPLTELPLYKRNLEDYETERDAFRALIVDTMSHYEVYQYMDNKERHTGDLGEADKKLFKRAKRIVRQRTPIVKAYGAETFTLFSQRAIQGLGGYGFMKEYDAERFHRDSFAPLLYEGTTQIQALMAMKDLVKTVMKNPRKYFGVLLYTSSLGSLLTGGDEYQKQMFDVKYEFKKNLAKLLLKCLRPQLDKDNGLDNLFNIKSWQSPKGIEKLMTHAETLHQTLSYLETLKVLARHARKDASRGDLFYRYYRLVQPRLVGVYTDWKLRE
ncbi:MAG TPA: acyl-CoA dehydrogenase family protein [Bacteriovoracaceae bacterium]|nr:acyl-CoA dehydrogenase family protein [Bacteriovoracaceae bacterium]